MGFKIKNNISAVNAVRNLNLNAMQQDKTLGKIASGLKVVTAADGPATMVMSEQMRSEIKGLEQVIQNSEVGISMVQTTEAYLEDVNTLLINLRQLAIHAANEAANDETMLEADQLEFDNVIQAIDRIATQSTFGTKKILDGSSAASAAVSGRGLSVVSVDETSKQTLPEGLEVNVTQLATQSSVSGTLELSGEIISAGELLTFTENGRTAQYQTESGDTIATIVEKVRNLFDKNGLDLAINATPEGILSVNHNKFGSEHAFEVSSSTAGILSEEPNTFRLAASGNDIVGRIGGERAEGKGQVLTAVDGADVSAGISLKYVGDPNIPGSSFPEGLVAGFVSVDQNSVRFQLGANKDENSTVSLANVSTTALGTGITNSSGFKSLNDIDIRTFQGANDAIEMIKQATTEIAAMRGKLGAVQKNNLESNLRTVNVARENMLQAESSLRDANIAEEMANLTREQALTNTSLAMLAQANQQPQTVLQLFQ